MEQPTRIEKLTEALTTPNEDLGNRTPLEAARDCGVTEKEIESATKTLLACAGSDEPQISILIVTGARGSEILRVDISGEVFINGSGLSAGSITPEDAKFWAMQEALLPIGGPS